MLGKTIRFSYRDWESAVEAYFRYLLKMLTEITEGFQSLA